MMKDPIEAATSGASLERIFAEGNRTFDIDRIGRGEGYGPNWVRCGDGTVISVVAGGGTYCSPRQDFGPFVAVEVWWPDADEPTGHVPVEEVRAFVAQHGGVVSVTDKQPAS